MSEFDFVTIEGGEGAGKTTLMRRLQAGMPDLYPTRKLVFTHEPGGSPRADLIRALVLSDSFKEASGKTMFGLMTAQRHDHIETLIGPELEAGSIVVCDRFVASTYAYQIVAQEQPELLPAFTAHRNGLGRYLPSLTIILDVDPRVARERMKKRTDQRVTHFDERPLEFHERLRVGFQKYAKDYEPWKIVTIDASLTEDEMYDEAVRAIQHRIR